MSALIQSPRLIQVPLVIAILNKLLQNKLIHSGNRRTEKTASLLIQREDLRRKNNVAHSDRRRYGFRKSSCIDHSAAAVISLQRRDRLPLIAELTVIIIFYDIAPRFLIRPLQKLHPSPDRHDDPQRILMGWHDKCNIRTGFSESVHLHAPAVHIHGTHLTGEIFENPVSLTVRRILKCDTVPASDDHDQEHKEIITARSDDDLLRAAVDSSRLMKITADRISQAVFSLGISQAEQFSPVIGKTLS